MNKVYRLIWNHAQQAWVVASELASGHGKGRAARRRRTAAVHGPRRTQRLSAGGPLIALTAGLFALPALAAHYSVSTEAELRQAIADANAHADPASTITLTANITVADPSAFVRAAKPLTLDTGAFRLDGAAATTNVAGTSLSFLGGPVVISGAFTGGAAAASASNRAGGSGLAVSDGTIDSSAILTGGAGGFSQRAVSTQAGAGGIGAALTNSSLINRGTLVGGLGGQMDNGWCGSCTNRHAASGGAGLSMTGGGLDNRGVIRGGVGGAIINAPTSADNAWGGIGGIGASLSGGTHTSSGTILGGQGGQGANKGGAAGAGAGGAGLVLNGGAALINQVGGNVTGGQGVPSLPSGGAASVGGAGANVAGATLENLGAITGGSGGSSTVAGGVGVGGAGSAVIVNDGSIVGGTPSGGGVRSAAVAFSGGNNLLELRSNASITGNVLGGATDTLALGGSANASFDVSQIGPAAQYRNFGAYHKLGASTWTLTGATAAVTPWTLRGGVLSISAESNLGAATGRLTFDGGTLQVTGAGYSGSSRPITSAAGGGGIDIAEAAHVFSLASAIDGVGGITKLGGGTLVFTADNTYAGGTTVSAGTLQLGNGGSTGGIASGTLLNNGVLVINRSNDMTMAGTISGSGSLSQAGTGTTTLAGINGYSGGTTIASGTLRGSATSFGSGAILNNGALVLDQVANGTLANLVTGTGTLTKQGSGTLTLSAGNSHSGATEVNAGTLNINGDQSAATGQTRVQSGGTLGGTGTLGGSVDVADGTLAPGAGGAGTLTVRGDLTLGSNAVLDFELGQAGVAGGALNDLLTVQGNLTLDGRLDVAESAGGSYGPGVYRLIDYSGTLVDNGLDLGTMPAGTTQMLQTSLAGQVNLINTQGLSLRWWDGDTLSPADRHDGQIAGGAGTWFANAPGTNINWTDVNGTPNGAFLDASFAMFTRAPGTVTVDGSLGAVRVSGMQFTVDGYRIQGDAITLGSGGNTVRVGDGTAASAGMSATIASVLTGTGRLDKADLGTLVLTAANSYTGGTTITGGTLQLGDGGASGSLVGNVANNGTLAFDRSDALGFGGAISGTGSVSQIGTGTTTLGGVNTYSGGTHIAAGTLVGSATSFGSGGIVNNAALVVDQAAPAVLSNAISGAGSFTKRGAGVLTLTGNSMYTGLTTISSGTLEFGAGGTSGSIVGDIVNNGALNFYRADSMTYAGNVTGFGDMTQRGTGVTTLTGNSEVNVLRVSAGELRLAGGAQMSINGAVNENLFISGAAAPVLTITGPQTSLTMTAQTVWVGDVGNASGVLNIEAGAQVNVAALASGRSLSAGSTGVTRVTGVGTLLEAGSIGLAGASYANSLSELQVSGGARVISGSHSSGNLARAGALASTVVSGAGTSWTNTGALALYVGSLDILDGASYQAATAGIGGYNLWAAAHSASLRVVGNGSTFTSTSDVNVGTANTTSGEITLSDAGRLTTGGTVVLGQLAGAAGTLNIGAAAADGARSAGVLDAVGITFGPGSGTLNFNHTSDDFMLGAAISGTGTMNHLEGTTTLTGNGSAFAGTTSVSGGTLLVNGTLGNTTSTLDVQNGGTLGGSGVIGGAVTVAAGGTIAPGNSPGTLTLGTLTLDAGAFLGFELGEQQVVGGAFNDLIVVNGNLVLDGTLNVTEAVAGTFDTGIYRLIDYTGALTDNILDIGTLPAGSNAADMFVQTELARQVNLVNTSGLTFRFWDGPAGHGNGVFDGDSGSWLATGNNHWTLFDPFANGGWADDAFAVFQGTPGTVTVDNSAGAVYFGGAQFMVDGYTIAGDVLTTRTAETVLRVGDGTAAGQGMTAVVRAEIAGTGALVKSDAGTLVLGAANSYSGGTTIRGGTLQLGEGGTSGSILGDVVNEGTLAFHRSDAVTFSGRISGSGSVVQAGAGTTVLTADNSYSGGTTITAGTLQLGDNSVAGGTTGGLVGDVANHGVLVVERSNHVVLAGLISGSGALVQQGSGTTRLSGNNSYTGATDIAGGTLVVDGDQSAANGAVTVRSGATLAGSGSLGGSVHVQAGGTLAAGHGGAGTLATGSLSLDAGARMAFDLGQVNVAGGVLNDLVTINGNLTLDGTLDVARTPGGSFNAGVYRLIDYSGTLTDRTLELGTLPAGSAAGELLVQTEVANQVNLVNTAGLTLSFWDGPDAATHDDGQFAGSDGRWTAGGNRHWTDSTAAVNGAWADNAFAVFMGAPGRVVVDHAAGAVNFSGAQFAVDGYVVEGDTLNTHTAETVIRVGDGTVAGQGMTATLNAAITGSGALVKADAGTLVLGGANRHSGGTTVRAGTLRAGAAQVLGATPRVEVAGGATLDLAGFDQTVAELSHAGTVSLVGAAPGTTLTVTGSYSGQGGLLRLGTALGDDASATDRVVLDGGHASGTTRVEIVNLGGLGAQTRGDGIEVIRAINGATTTAQTTQDAFAMVGGHVAAGAFEYRLLAGDANGAGENWYLRSTLAGAGPGVVTYRPEVALNAAVPALLARADLSLLGTLHRRLGDRAEAGATPSNLPNEAWGRLIREASDIRQHGAVSPRSDNRSTGLQIGLDLLRRGDDRLGVYAGHLSWRADVSGHASGIADSEVGSASGSSRYLGAYWTHVAEAGWYSDLVLQQGWQRGNTHADPATVTGNGVRGASTLASLELGRSVRLSGAWSLEPQLQFIVGRQRLVAQHIPDARFERQADTTLTTRLGLRLKGGAAGEGGRLQPYGQVNVWHAARGATTLRVQGPTGGADIRSERGSTSGEVVLGGTWRSSERVSVYGELGHLFSLDSGAGQDTRASYAASFGVRVGW